LILLLEPPRPAGFVSGGYRYQAEIGAQLAARGEGALRVVAPDAIEAAITGARPGTSIVVDGLFVARRARPLPDGVIALLHGTPAQSPWATAPLPVIATSQRTADAVAGTARGVEVVRPGLDACFHGGTPRTIDGRLRIVCIGTVGPGKGQRLLAAAIATAPTVARCELELIGDTSSAPEYARACALAAAPATVLVRGVLPPNRVAAALRSADLCVSASRDESFGMAVAEAVACGTPVLAFATGEIASFVRDGKNGWLLPADASDREFTDRLHALLAEPLALALARRTAAAPPLAAWDEVARRFVAAVGRLRR
jgi:glycosyltransferase involved in cell wall biosynthesis